MHKAVTDFLNKQNELKKEQREQFLLDNNICEIEYAPEHDEFVYDETYGGQYPDYDYDKERFCRKIPIEVTDEEFELIKKAYEENRTAPMPFPDEEPDRNFISVLLKIVGAIVLLGGLIIGFFACEDDDYVVASIYWAGAFISSLLFFALSEIVRLLHEINSKQR